MSATKEENKIRGNWTPLNIISIILGTVIFWPLGLFLLVWVLMDRDVTEIFQMISKECRSLIEKFPKRKTATGNRVFDEFQQTQLDRIEEIKKEIRERYYAFNAYKEERDRAVEEREFAEFMKKKPSTTEKADQSPPANPPSPRNDRR